MRISLIIVGIMALSLTGADNSVTKLMKENVKDIKRFLKLKLVSDVKDNNMYIGQSFNLTINTANEILDYVEKSMIETVDKVENTLETMTKDITNNFNEIREKTSSNLNSLQKLCIGNEVSIANDCTKELNNIVDKMETRMKQHEDCLGCLRFFP